MPKFRATVRLSVSGTDPAAVHRTIDERMKAAGFERWRVRAVRVEGSPRPPRRAFPRGYRYGRDGRRRSDLQGVLLVGAAAWAVWFFWLLSR